MDENIRLKLKNDFHHTSCVVNIKGEIINAKQVKQIKYILCGLDNCYCAGELGTRGKQEWADTYNLQESCDSAGDTIFIVVRLKKD